MSFGSTLLRLFLCLALALNGVSAARASMHLEHGAPEGTARSATPAAMDGMAGMPCHEMEQGRAAAPSQVSTPDSDEGGKAPAPDCCKGGCQCACLQHATPAIAAIAFPPMVVHAAVRWDGATAHAAPAALRLNRPPIG